jgi:hypothetical protein
VNIGTRVGHSRDSDEQSGGSIFKWTPNEPMPFRQDLEQIWEKRQKSLLKTRVDELSNEALGFRRDVPDGAVLQGK